MSTKSKEKIPETRKKANLRDMSDVKLSTLVEYLKKVGEVEIQDIIYSTKKIMPTIGSNSGNQFVQIQGDNRPERLGFTLFSRATVHAGLQDNTFYKNDDAEKKFLVALDKDGLRSIFKGVEKAYSNKQKKAEAKTAKLAEAETPVQPDAEAQDES